MTLMRYAEALNAALREEMQRDPSVFLFGEDIGRYGGVFKDSKGLRDEFGDERVRDTPISEQALTAMAVTAAMTYALALENAQAAWPENNNLRLLVPMATFSVACFLAVVVFHVSAAVIIILGGFFGAFFLRTPEPDPVRDEEPGP